MASGQNSRRTIMLNGGFLKAFFVLSIALQSCTVMRVSAENSSSTTTTTTTTTTKTTARPMMPAGSEATTTMLPSMEGMTTQCTKMSDYDCCQEFEDYSLNRGVEILRQVITVENNKQNKTVWSLETIDSLRKKDCPKPFYMAKVTMNKSPIGGNNSLSVDCQILFLYSGSDDASAGEPVDEVNTIEVKEFCNDAVACRVGLFITILLPLLTLLSSRRH